MDNTITIYDIAKALNISSSTVSRALNNHPRISEATKKRVQEYAQQNGYEPNVVASNLRTKKTNTIGVIVPRISRHFFSSAISGIEEFAKANGYRTLISQSYDDFEHELECTQTLLSSRVDGVIASLAMETTNVDHYKKLVSKNIPLVFFDRVSDEIETNKVIVDDFNGGFKATEHLIQQGCTRIAHFAGSQNHNIYINRLQGYMKALRKHNMPVEEELIIYSDITRESGTRIANEILSMDNRPDGIFSANDTAALSTMLVAKEMGINIPLELSIVGFSNEPYSELLEVPLSTIDQSGVEVGQKSAELLINQINQGSDEEAMPQTVMLPVKLLERKSSDRS